MPELPTLGTVSPDDFRRIRQVFEAALERPVPQRQTFIEQGCGGNTLLMAEVERMLAAEAERVSLVDGAALAVRRSDGSATQCSSCDALLDVADRFCRTCGTPARAGHGDEGRFRAGALFANRFRIVARLGRGGMGEVYRANDLELGQPVALKFLTAFHTDERARARLRTEVRLARQLAHPNVCRVYDIGESHGDLYLSMEYVDGEDLAALLKRIGRLPIDKGIEIARKLCAGLAAAHAKGVLHRDFKPANIMIDSHGEVRIMDFGLAAIADQLEAHDVRSGTPAYMAPEQLAGKDATKQSDLYALGLVLYELFTGKAAFEAKTVEEFLRLRAAQPATTPSTLIPDIGPRLESAILRCLEPDSAQRPASALDVAALLPGGDPLAEALAAGETPSPEIVAAAGPTHVLSPRLATGLLAAIAVSLVTVFWLTGRSQMLNQLPLEYPPEVLAERAREIVRAAGYKERAADSAFGFESDSRYVRYFDDTLAGSQRDRRETWTSLLSRSPSPLTFWYIHSASPLVPLTSGLATLGRVERDQPLIQRATVLVELDPDGRLRRFVATRMDRDTASDSAASVDWSALFSTAGLDFSRFTPDSRPASADTELAWTGVYPGHDNLPVKVEARSQGGRLMQFAVLFPWTEREDAALSALGLAGASGGPVTVLVNYVFIIAIVLVAYRNWKIGRADLTGASRVALFIGTLLFLIIVLFAHDGLATLMYQPSVALVAFEGLMAGLAYIALEPWVRRSWPQAMVTWSRVLAGRWRDPVVARDILVGIALAVVIYCFRQSLYAVFMPGRGMPPGSNAVLGFAFMPVFLTGGRVVAAGMLAELMIGLTQALSIFFLLFLCRVLLPRPWMSVVAFVAAMALLTVGLWWSDTRWIEGLSIVVFSLLTFPVIVRFGFVTFAVWGWMGGMLGRALVTNQFGAWYGQSSLAVLVVITAVTLWAFWTSIGRPAIGFHEATS